MEPLIKERRELVTEGKRNDLIFSHMFGMFTWEIKKKNPQNLGTPVSTDTWVF